MQIAVDISTEDIIRGIKKMNFHELEEVKNAIIKRDIYFKKFKKDKIENVIADFEAEGYSDDFLKDLENGLRKSSVYNENKTS